MQGKNSASIGHFFFCFVLFYLFFVLFCPCAFVSSPVTYVHIHSAEAFRSSDEIFFVLFVSKKKNIRRDGEKKKNLFFAEV